MRVDQAVNIEDLHRMAKRRLPKIAFDFIEGGLEDERGLETNTSAFHKHRLLPRYLVDVSKRDQTKTIFGQTFNSPFRISPTGGAGLFRYHAHSILAAAARRCSRTGSLTRRPARMPRRCTNSPPRCGRSTRRPGATWRLTESCSRAPS